MSLFSRAMYFQDRGDMQYLSFDDNAGFSLPQKYSYRDFQMQGNIADDFFSERVGHESLE